MTANGIRFNQRGVSVGKAIACPLCGWEMQKGDMRSTGFRCPGCREQLRVDTGYAWPTFVASLPLAALSSYLAGIRGTSLFIAVLFLWIPFYVVGAVVTSRFGPRFVKDTPKRGDLDFRLTGPPDPPKKP
jgi:hypothetical protein